MRQDFQSQRLALRSAVSCTRYEPDATAVLAAIKVVRPAGPSTLTAAAGRNIMQPRRDSTTGHNPSQLPD